MALKKKGKKGALEVDFTGVESGGKAVPDGVHPLEVVEVTAEESSEGNPYLKWKYKVTGGPAAGAIVYDNTSLQPQALWRLKGLLETLGVEVPDSSMELELDEYVGMTMNAVIANESYQGKDRPKIAQYGGEVENEGKSSSAGKSGKSSGKTSSSQGTSSKKSEDADTDADGDPVFEVKQKVTFEDGGKKYSGTITAIDGDSATVKTKNGEEWELDVSDLTAE